MRNMTKEEKEGKAICTDCIHSVHKRYFEDRPCAQEIQGLFCNLQVAPGAFNFVDGTVNEYRSASSLCKIHNGNGQCKSFIHS